MPIVKWTPMLDPFDEFDKFFSGVPALSQTGGFVPSMDIYEEKDRVVAEVQLAGIKPEDVNISIENDILTIEGQSEKKSEMEEKNYYRKEVRTGSFHRSVALPAGVKGEEAEAEYENGILKISIPKAESAKPKTVKVQIKKK